MKLPWLLLLGLSSVVSAEPLQQPLSAPGTAPDHGFVGEPGPDGLILARQVLPATRPIELAGIGVAAVAQSRIIYLNKNGVTLRPGDNDSRTQYSSIATQVTTIPAWTTDAATWSATVSCMRDLFSRFDVQVVDTDPGAVPHMEAVFGGSPTQLGLASGVAGVSPFTTDCGIIENSIVFTFTGAYSFTARQACEIMAQEVAHSYGLDHELLASDPMTYLNYTGNRAFQDQAVSCGEYASRACGINGSTCRANQNSVQLLTERIGLGDAIAPILAWASPANNATVPPGFQVNATGTDNIAVANAVLEIDGVQADMIAGPGPYTFTTAVTLAEGPHMISVEISDGKNIQSETRTVTVAKNAPGSGTGSDDLAGGNVVGGCSTGKGSLGMLLGLALLGLRRRR